MDMIFSTAINGLNLGTIYALIALGYTMVYGIAKMLNFAHGDIIMVGAYAIYSTMFLVGNFYIALIFSIIICIILGIMIERLAYRPLRGASPLAVLITAIGVSYLLQGVAQLIYGSAPLPIQQVKVSPIITLAVSTVIMVALTVFVNKTKTGKAMLAVSEDKQAAQLVGINVNKTIAITFAIGSALAAVASASYVISIPSTSPTLGSMPGIKAFTAAVIGGIGSIPGAMVGGIFLGVVEKICMAIPAISSYTTAIEFSFLIIILLFKPTGFLGKKKREKV